METTGVPDFVKVECLKGFRAHVDGKFTIVNPGDVVTVAKATAIDLRLSQKAVMTDKAERVQKDYLPERKRMRIGREKAERDAYLRSLDAGKTAEAPKAAQVAKSGDAVKA